MGSVPGLYLQTSSVKALILHSWHSWQSEKLLTKFHCFLVNIPRATIAVQFVKQFTLCSNCSLCCPAVILYALFCVRFEVWVEVILCVSSHLSIARRLQKLLLHTHTHTHTHAHTHTQVVWNNVFTESLSCVVCRLLLDWHDEWQLTDESVHNVNQSRHWLALSNHSVSVSVSI